MLTPPSYHFDSCDKALEALLEHLENCCCRASEVQQPIELWMHASISIGFQRFPRLRSSRQAHQKRSFSRDPLSGTAFRGCRNRAARHGRAARQGVPTVAATGHVVASGSGAALVCMAMISYGHFDHLRLLSGNPCFGVTVILGSTVARGGRMKSVPYVRLLRNVWGTRGSRWFEAV